MVYKKFIKRDGKIYGPYSYKSRKENGKVITDYLGKSGERDSPKFSSKKIKISFLVLGIVFVLASLIFLNLDFTGKVALQIEKNYLAGESIEGNLKLSLQNGELIPVGTKVVID